MYIIRFGWLSLDKLVCSSLGKTTYFPCSQFSLVFYRVLCRLRLCGLIQPNLACPLGLPFFRWHLESCWWEFMCITSDICGTHSRTGNSIFLWLLLAFCMLFCNVSWAIGAGEFCRFISWDLALNLCILIDCAFQHWLHMLHNVISLMRSEHYTSLGILEQMFICYY